MACGKGICRFFATISPILEKTMPARPAVFLFPIWQQTVDKLNNISLIRVCWRRSLSKKTLANSQTARQTFTLLRLELSGLKMNKLLTALAATTVSMAAATASQAATFTYTLNDFTDQPPTIDFDYGLRLDRESPTGRFFSFEGLQGDAVGATLTYDSTAGTAIIEGTVRESLGNDQFGDFFDIEYVLSGLTALTNANTGAETGGFVDTTGSGQGFVFGAGDRGSDLSLGAASQVGGPFDDEFFFHFGFDAIPEGTFTGLEGTGWVESGPGFNDFRFSATLAPVPLPGAAWMLLASLAGMGFVARRKTQS